MILSGILWFLTWPLTIYISYQLIKYVLNKVESNLEEVSE
jgi:hypothetical protein